MRVLVADDQPLVRDVVCDLVASLGHEAVPAADGRKAWELLRAEPFRIIVSDWMMPGLTGPDLCARVRTFKDREYTYFILLTGVQADAMQYLDAMAKGVDDFLRKPVDGAELSVRLRVAERIVGLSSRVRQLERLLPICMYCKRIRGGDKSYEPLEAYITGHSDTRFSHVLCPECLAEHHPDAPARPGGQL